jgi:septation ring formation regulator EzrA
MAKSNKQVIEEEVIKLQKLMSWWEHYTAIGNPIEANKAQKEIEEQKRKISELRKTLGVPKSK